MKTFKGLILALLFCGIVMACGGDGNSASEQSTDDLSAQSTNDLTDREQAELVAAALTAKEGGLGNDLENISQSASQEGQSLVQRDLDLSAEMEFYDAQGARQENFDFDTTNSIQYDSHIKGNLTIKSCYFQEFNLDNQSNFTVDEILSGVAVIDGTHHLHSSYTRKSTLTGTDVSFNLDCNLDVTGVTVKMNTIDVIPDMGTVNGLIAGSYVRNGVHADINNQFNFEFNVTYMGDNTAEIDLGGDVVFSLNLDTGVLIEVEIG